MQKSLCFIRVTTFLFWVLVEMLLVVLIIAVVINVAYIAKYWNNISSRKHIKNLLFWNAVHFSIFLIMTQIEYEYISRFYLMFLLSPILMMHSGSKINNMP